MHGFLLVVGDNVEAQLEPFGDEYVFAARPKDASRKPNEKYDYYQIGWRWKHTLELGEPRQKRWFFCLLHKAVTRTCTAKKSEIIEDSLLQHPPVSVLIEGVWEDAEFIIGQPPDGKWHKRFEQIYRSMPESARLTVVDYHA